MELGAGADADPGFAEGGEVGGGVASWEDVGAVGEWSCPVSVYTLWLGSCSGGRPIAIVPPRTTGLPDWLV